jgi:hypothetical protein
MPLPAAKSCGTGIFQIDRGKRLKPGEKRRIPVLLRHTSGLILLTASEISPDKRP